MWPYSDVDAVQVKQFADTVEWISRAEAVITHKKSKRTVEAITGGFRVEVSRSRVRASRSRLRQFYWRAQTYAS